MAKPILIISDERAINLLVNLYGVHLTPSVLAILLQIPQLESWKGRRQVSFH
jgi:hypothetical protein